MEAFKYVSANKILFSPGRNGWNSQLQAQISDCLLLSCAALLDTLH